VSIGEETKGRLRVSLRVARVERSTLLASNPMCPGRMM